VYIAPVSIVTHWIQALFVNEYIKSSQSMKIVSVILIIAYLMLPAVCFGHPCGMNTTHAQHFAIASDDSAECPLNHDTDYCETTCCCAGHVPFSAFSAIPYNGLTARLMPYEPGIALPRLIDRIFVPPQNLS
jgi:hypothetical protein